MTSGIDLPAPKSKINLLLGEPLETAAASHQTIGKAVGLAVFASDALSSVAYATEEILFVLAVAGVLFFHLALPIAAVICLLLLILTFSYRQTIFAYPGGGGAYIVSRDNLGEKPAQVAGAALLTDYTLTVAVSISSGIAQVTSALPALAPYHVEICLACLAGMTIINLRGVKESGKIFAGPTYAFIFMAVTMIAVGFYRYFTGTLGTVQGVEMVKGDVEGLTIFLVLRAFSSGCTALTGVEAISNGIPAFNKPQSRNAATTMLWMSGTLGLMFLGITYLALQVKAVPSEHQTVIYQLASTVFSGWMWPLYYIMAFSTTLILIMAANTSFADFPRLAALQAGDSFLPRQLTWRGHRLVFSQGITALAGLAGLLIFIFQGDTHLLIPLYAIGVFLSFTLSQAGMVIRWQKVGQLKPGEEITTANGSVLTHDRNWRWKQVINGVGCLMTGIVMIVFAISKFTQGAWVVVLLIPLMVTLFFRINRSYAETAKSLSISEGQQRKAHAGIAETIVLVEGYNQATDAMVRFAQSLGKPWVPVHIAVDPVKAGRCESKWNTNICRYEGEGFLGQPLQMIDSPYRWMGLPLRRFVLDMRRRHPDQFIHVVVGSIVPGSWFGHLLHQNAQLLIWVTLATIRGVAITVIPTQTNGAYKAAVAAEREPNSPQI